MTKKQPELKFMFSYADIEVIIDTDMYSDEDQLRINNIIKCCSKNIEIDKTYVDFKNTLYEKTFMTEKGWKCFCKLVRKTQFGNKCTKSQHLALQENYELMILCYLYQLLEDYGYDCAGVCLQIKGDSHFMVQIFNDCSTPAKYLGKWQSWDSSQKI